MELFISAEGIHTGQFVNCSKKAQLNIGNVFPVGTMTEGTIVCYLEENPGYWGKLAEPLETMPLSSPTTQRPRRPE